MKVWRVKNENGQTAVVLMTDNKDIVDNYCAGAGILAAQVEEITPADGQPFVIVMDIRKEPKVKDPRPGLLYPPGVR